MLLYKYYYNDNFVKSNEVNLGVLKDVTMIINLFVFDLLNKLFNYKWSNKKKNNLASTYYYYSCKVFAIAILSYRNYILHCTMSTIFTYFDVTLYSYCRYHQLDIIGI